jgi:histidinol-phosphate/aromatic aminotransferase/cobyric acid decarboxylase-like protein
MSKALSLAGLRMGWIVDADPERRKKLIDARSYFTISSSPVMRGAR